MAVFSWKIFWLLVSFLSTITVLGGSVQLTVHVPVGYAGEKVTIIFDDDDRFSEFYRCLCSLNKGRCMVDFSKTVTGSYRAVTGSYRVVRVTSQKTIENRFHSNIVTCSIEGYNKPLNCTKVDTRNKSCNEGNKIHFFQRPDEHSCSYTCVGIILNHHFESFNYDSPTQPCPDGCQIQPTPNSKSARPLTENKINEFTSTPSPEVSQLLRFQNISQNETNEKSSDMETLIITLTASTLCILLVAAIIIAGWKWRQHKRMATSRSSNRDVSSRQSENGIDMNVYATIDDDNLSPSHFRSSGVVFSSTYENMAPRMINNDNNIRPVTASRMEGDNEELVDEHLVYAKVNKNTKLCSVNTHSAQSLNTSNALQYSSATNANVCYSNDKPFDNGGGASVNTIEEMDSENIPNVGIDINEGNHSEPVYAAVKKKSRLGKEHRQVSNEERDEPLSGQVFLGYENCGFQFSLDLEVEEEA